MRVFVFPLLLVRAAFRCAAQTTLRGFLWFALCVAPIHQAAARETSTAAPKDEFASLVELAPMVVGGQSLAISIYARTKSDRRYGGQFAERVVKVVHEGVTESTGRGLVIIGVKGEQHPVSVFENFQALAQSGKLDPAVAAYGAELSAMLDRWREGFGNASRGKREKSVDVDFDQILPALPLPLKGVGAKLYQLAWEEKFNEAKVEAKLRALRPEDLERRDLFKAYDWVFYLPPKGAFDRVLDEIIASALKKEKMGFATRTLVKGALLVVKPKIRRAIEGMRQSMMFSTILHARTSFTKDEVSKLMRAYQQVYTPGEKSTEGSEHQRAVTAVRACLQLMEQQADPAKSLPAPALSSPAGQVP